MTGTRSDQIIDKLDVRLRRGDRILLGIGWLLVAGGISGVAGYLVAWPHTAGPVVGVAWPAIVAVMGVLNLVTGKRVRVMQEHIRWQRERLCMLTDRERAR